MGLLFTKLWSLFGTKEHKLVLIGLDNAGKTTILYQFTMGEVVQTSPTIGSNVEEIRYYSCANRKNKNKNSPGKNIKFIIWDLGGQTNLRNYWSTYFSNVEFVIVVIDSTDIERFNLLKTELNNYVYNNTDLVYANFLFFCNKQDVKGALSPSAISKELNLTALRHRWQIQPCCALTGEGLEQGLDWIANIINNNSFQSGASPPPQPQTNNSSPSHQHLLQSPNKS